MAGAKLTEGEFEQDAGFAEAGGGFEEEGGLAFEGGGQFDGRGLLTRARGGKGRSVGEVTEAFTGAEPEVEELGDSLEFDAKEMFVGGSEGEGLGKAAGGFDEDELGAERRNGGPEGAETREGDVGGELSEVAGVIATQFGFVGGERARDGLDLAEHNGRGRWRHRPQRSVTCWERFFGERFGREPEELVDAAVEGEGPAAVENAPLDRDFKFGSGAVLGGGLGAELLVPVSAELRAPDALGTAGAFAGAQSEI